MKVVILIALFMFGCAHHSSSHDSAEKGIDRELIRLKIRENVREFEHCYNLGLKEDKNLYGKIEVQWHIVDGGKVEKAIIKTSTIKNKTMETCMLTVLEKITFPEPPKDQIAEVIYPFVFSSN
jgi:hypothetical protein